MAASTHAQKALQGMRQALATLQHQLADLPLSAARQAGLQATAWRLEAQLTVLEGEAWLLAEGQGTEAAIEPSAEEDRQGSGERAPRVDQAAQRPPAAEPSGLAAADNTADLFDGFEPSVSAFEGRLPRTSNLDRLLEKLADAAPQLLYLVDIERFTNVYVNRQVEEILGVTAAEVQHKGPQFFAEMIHPDDAAVVQHHLERLLASTEGQMLELEYRAHHADGSWRWLQSREVVFKRNAEGKVTHILGMAIDVSQRKQAELDLQANRDLLSQVLDNIDGCCCLRDGKTGELLYISSGYERLFRRPRQEVYDRAQAWLKYVHPEDCDRIQRQIQAELQGQTLINDEFRIVLPDGQVRWIWAVSLPIYGPAGEIDRIVDLKRDVTERKQIETALRESEARFRSTSEQSAVGICHCDVRGRFLWVNPALCQLLGYTQNELLALTFQDITHPADLPKQPHEGLQALSQSVRACSLEKRYLRKDARVIWGHVTISPVYDDRGTILYLTGIIQDISDQKQMDADLRNSLHEKDLLLAEVHHRVKNNLQIISSLLELQANRVSDALARQVLIASQNRVIAMALIHETLYHSGNLAQIDFDEYVRQLVAGLFRIYGADTSLNLSLTGESALTLPSDLAISLGLILNELVTNALKHGFTPSLAGTLTVELKRLPSGWCRLTVSHLGARLPTDFDLEQSSSMGLKLVRLLVQRIHGHLVVEREPQTAFAIQFPLMSAHPPTANSADR